MKIQINQDSGISETEITVNCNRLDGTIEKIISMLRMLDYKLTGVKDKQTFVLDTKKVLYIESVDKKTFLYTTEEVYESPLRLYELEEQLAAIDFLRANKSCIINFNQIKALKADLDGKLLITMNNNERLFVSRQYAPGFKEKLGVK